MTAASKDRAYSRKEVSDIVRSVMDRVQGSEATAHLHTELAKIMNYIENMRSELAQMRSIEISHNHIPAASDELDAVVAETADATGRIMDACEGIETVGGRLGGADGEALTGAVTSIYEACSFQDITGQRINKVVKTLKSIEAKISDIVQALSAGAALADGTAPAAPVAEKKDSLLNGPQLKGSASSQEEIDRLLASFD